MSTRAATWRRIGAGAVAAATSVAGMPLLLSGPAVAAAAVGLSITQDNGRSTAAAGTCTAFTVTPVDVVGGRPEVATITVSIAESPEGDSHDVDFCLVDGDSTSVADDGTPFFNPPRYTSAAQAGTTPTLGVVQRYNAGPSVTAAPADSTETPPGRFADPDQPDVASGAEPVASVSSVPNRNNPGGVDRASFVSDGGPVRFGVVGLLPGAAATVDAFVDEDADLTEFTDSTQLTREDDVRAARKTITFTDGGLPGSRTAADAVRRVIMAPDESIAALTSAGRATHTFSVTLLNADQDVVGGVEPRVISTAGPDSAGTFGGDCGLTQNEGGAATCTYSPEEAGSDTVSAFVNQTTGAPTFGLDATEPRDTATALTTEPPVAAPEARLLQLTPLRPSISTGQSQVFVATVTDGAGRPARDVDVTFFEDGPGRLDAAAARSGVSSTRVDTTDETGRAVVTFVTAASDSGVTTVFASVSNPSATQCQQTTAPLGRCTDSSRVTIAAAGTSSPTGPVSSSASAAPSASPRPTTTPSPTTTTTPSPTATAPRPSSPSSPSPSCSVASISLDRDTITATGSAQLTVHGTANSIVDVFAYSRPSTTYRSVREISVGADGLGSDRLVPPTNTRLYAQQRGCGAGPSIVLNVRTHISLDVVRNGRRNYTFSGRLLPTRPRGHIASLYRVTDDGRQILTAQQRANAARGQAGYDPSRPEGSYIIGRRFTGSGRFGFVVRTGQDLQNAPGSSNVRSLAVF